MRIAIDSNIFTMQEYGGVSRYLVRLAEELIGMGNTVKIHGLLHTNRHLRDSNAELSDMHYICRFPKYTRRLSHLVGDLFANKQLSNSPPDLIHESYCHNRMIGSVNTPRVCTIHDMIHELYPEFWGKMDRTPEYRRSTVNRCKAIICVSNHTKHDLLSRYDIDESKVHVVHHGFEHISHNHSSSQTDELTAQDFKTFPYLLYVGARGKYKNFLGFLTGLSLSDLRNQLNVISFGGGPFTAEEHTKIYSLGFKPGQIKQVSGPDALLQSLYRDAAAFVYPSLYEGFGLPPLEAMAEGCPVISSNTSSMPEVIGDAAEYFIPNSPESISLSIDNVIRSEERKLELIRLGKERIRHFSWQKCASATEAVYRSIA